MLLLRTNELRGFALTTLRATVLASLVSASTLGVAGCARPDPRFATPEATVHTLFTAYGVGLASESTLRARLVAHERFRLRDPVAYRSCFADFERDEDEGAAGFVFGRLAAVRDHLVIRTRGDRATIRASADSPAIPTVHLRKRGGGFRIVLRESVPREAREQLRAVFRRQRERLERQGLGSR